MKKFFLIPLAIGVVVALIAGSCGKPEAAPAPGPAPAPKLSDLDRLYQAAKAEGKVILGWATTTDEIKPVIAAFEARYPGIKVEAFTIRTGDAETRVAAESAAKKLTMDLVQVYPYNMLSLIERNIPIAYDWTKLGVPADRIELNATALREEDGASIWMYNTQLVSKNDAPRSWEDLLNPKWKGRIITSSRASGMFLGLFPEWKKNPKKVEDYLKKLRAQDPIKGEAQEPLNRLSSGECLIGATPLIRGLPAIKQGAPFALAPISPTYGLSVVVTVPKGSPNPNGAKLLAAWLAGPQGTAELLKIGRGVLGPPQLALSEQAKLLANSGVAYQGVTTLEDIKLMSGPYADKLSQIMGWPK